jgi:hypothetical protein
MWEYCSSLREQHSGGQFTINVYANSVSLIKPLNSAKKEIKMKTLISLVAMMMVTLAFGTAYAGDDQIPYPGMAIVPVAHSTFDWSAKGQAAADQIASYTNDETPVLSSNNEIGTALYHEAFEVHQTVLADRAKKGSAAGGMAKENVNSITFYKLTE